MTGIKLFSCYTEVVEEFSAQRVPVEYWRCEETEGERAGGQEEEVKVGVWVGEEGGLALRAEERRYYYKD